MIEFIILLIALAVAVVVLKLSTAKAQATAVDGIVASRIISDNELEFFHRLQRTLPDLLVFPQVSANALLKVAPGVSKKRYHATRNRFAQKHVDYVVCHPMSLDPLAIIELDDRTHNTKRDQLRDAMFEQAGYRIIRFESRRKPSDAEIAALFPPATPKVPKAEAVQF